MGKLILCSGKRTNRPYVLPSAGIRIYSIEELCYYIYHYICFIEEDMFTDSLIDWIGNELMLIDRASKLRQLKEQGTDLKTLITVVLCSSDYYTEAEIKGLIKIIDEMTFMSPMKRNCIRADRYLANKQYIEAIAEYERILNSKDTEGLSPEEYGDILHNLAVAKVHISGLTEAAELFYQAYERNQRKETLYQYLYALKIVGEDIFREKTEEYQIEEVICDEINHYISDLQSRTEQSDLMPVIQKIDQYRLSGRMNEYYRLVIDIINTWKAKLRQI